MVELNEIVTWLNDYLDIGTFVEDSSMNGLQVEAENEVKKIAFAVDACVESFEKAKKAGADLVIVHHGLYWTKQDYLIRGTHGERIKFLIDNGLSLYASHLPLDANYDVGNNAEMIRALEIKKFKKTNYVDYVAECDLSFEELKKKVEEKIGPIKVWKFGSDKVKTLHVCSGGGSRLIKNFTKDITFLVGEFGHSAYHYAKEKKINVIEAGHYNTEKFGVLALMKKIKSKFNVETVFIDSPTQM